MEPKDTKPAAGAATAAEEIAQAQARGFAEGRAEGLRAGAEAERTRVAGILAHAEAGERRALAEHLAFKTPHSIEDASALLAAAPKAASATNLLAERMAKEKQPKLGADVEVTGQTSVPKIDAAKVYQLRRAAADAAA